MAAETSSKPSFSPYRKWGIGLHVGLVVLLVLAVVVMTNYLSQDCFYRFHLTGRTQNPLSTRTLRFLASMTNRVSITLYYSKEDRLYSTVADLLHEYELANPRITVQTVDYVREPSAAEKIKSEYSDYKLAADSEKNLILFNCEGRKAVFPGDKLAQYTLEQTRDEKEPFRRKLVAFQGESCVTATLIALTKSKLHTYCLTGHGEHRIDSGDELKGYMDFASVVRENYVQLDPLSLMGSNGVPTDCSLLIVAGPTAALLPDEVPKLEQYLNQGGRLLVLFNSEAIGRETGWEKILAQWGVGVGTHLVVDPEHTTAGLGLVVSAFSTHPLVNPLLNSGICLIRPRAVGRLSHRTQPADAPKVDEIAFTGKKGALSGNPAVPPQPLPLMVAVEKGAIKGVATERGTTRMVVVGDSVFLANHQLDLLENRNFAGYMINWLLERTELLQGPGPHAIKEYRLVMTHRQMQSAQAILLVGMPGAVLAFGALVWYRRRR